MARAVHVFLRAVFWVCRNATETLVQKAEEIRCGEGRTVIGGNMPEQSRDMAAEQPRQIDWDLKELMERLDGDESFLCELLVMFREDVRMNLAKPPPRSKQLPGKTARINQRNCWKN
jgi:hypothetical protein